MTCKRCGFDSIEVVQMAGLNLCNECLNLIVLEWGIRLDGELLESADRAPHYRHPRRLDNSLRPVSVPTGMPEAVATANTVISSRSVNFTLEVSA